MSSAWDDISEFFTSEEDAFDVVYGGATFAAAAIAYNPSVETQSVIDAGRKAVISRWFMVRADLLGGVEFSAGDEIIIDNITFSIKEARQDSTRSAWYLGLGGRFS